MGFIQLGTTASGHDNQRAAQLIDLLCRDGIRAHHSGIYCYNDGYWAHATCLPAKHQQRMRRALSHAKAMAKRIIEEKIEFTWEGAVPELCSIPPEEVTQRGEGNPANRVCGSRLLANHNPESFRKQPRAPFHLQVGTMGLANVESALGQVARWTRLSVCPGHVSSLASWCCGRSRQTHRWEA